MSTAINTIVIDPSSTSQNQASKLQNAPIFENTLELNSDQIQAFRRIWRDLAHSKSLTAQHAALRSIVLRCPLSLPFTPITNPKKLSNGYSPWQGALDAVGSLRQIRKFPQEFLAILSEDTEKISMIARSVSLKSSV